MLSMCGWERPEFLHGPWWQCYPMFGVQHWRRCTDSGLSGLQHLHCWQVCCFSSSGLLRLSTGILLFHGWSHFLLHVPCWLLWSDTTALLRHLQWDMLSWLLVPSWIN